MNPLEFIKKKIFRAKGLIKTSNPASERLTYINDAEAIRISNIRANRYWYIGNGDELLNWYTNQQTYGYAQNPIYNRNKRQYFWGRSVIEQFKRIHSGVPRAIMDTLSNIVGMPTATGNEVNVARLHDIFDVNDFEFMLCQRARPMASVEGDGAFKININPSLCNHPLIEYYGAEDWGPIKKSNVLLGMYFKSYYKDKNDKDYVLFETRSLRNEGLAIEYDLFKIDKSNQMIPCELKTIPELEGLKSKLINGLKNLLAIPLKYYYDPINPDRGKPIFDGKLDLFDFLDEILSQAGQTNRVSTPVEYYPTDLLKRTDRGQPMLPNVYNRQYIQVEGTIDGDGNTNSQIQTTQPDLNFEQYDNLYTSVLNDTLIGILSPATLGLDLARKDNAEAQREKEKQSIFTRQLFVKSETKVLKIFFNMLLMADDYIATGIIEDKDYDIGIKYDEFANPSFESEVQILGPAWSNGQISTERYVSLLWAGKLSDEEMAQEIAWLDENKQKDDFDINSLMEHENETNDRINLQEEESKQENIDGAKE